MAQDWNDWITSVYQASYDRMYRVAYRLTGDCETAKDLVQDAFLQTLFRQDELLLHPKPEAWIMQTLTNLCKNENRRLSSKNLALDALLQLSPSEDRHSLEEWLPTQLKPRERMLLIWRFQEQLEYSEIADRLGITPAGSRSGVFRALANCKKWLDEKNFS